MSDYVLNLGDCLDPATGLASLADKSVAHVICDPPFEAEAHTLQRRIKPNGWRHRNGSATVESPLSFPPITESERTACAVEAGRLARRWVLLFCQIEASHKWIDSLVSAGLTYRRTCLWIKPDGMPQFSGDRPGMGYETIVCAHANGKSTWNGGGQHGVFECPKWEGEKHVHETQKPVALMEKLVRLFTDPGDLILDPFAGSGTTGVAAIRMGRRFIGFERDEKYHAIATRRLAATREQMEMFE